MEKCLRVREIGDVHDIGDPVLQTRAAARHLYEVVPFVFEGREVIPFGEFGPILPCPGV